MLGCADLLSPWSACIGGLLYPDHEWKICYNRRVVGYRSLSAAVGFREEPKKSIVVMDILRCRHVLDRGRDEDYLRSLMGRGSSAIWVEEAVWAMNRGGLQEEEG
jgi:hypothetical protein